MRGLGYITGGRRVHEGLEIPCSWVEYVIDNNYANSSTIRYPIHADNPCYHVIRGNHFRSDAVADLGVVDVLEVSFFSSGLDPHSLELFREVSCRFVIPPRTDQATHHRIVREIVHPLAEVIFCDECGSGSSSGCLGLDLLRAGGRSAGNGFGGHSR